MASVKWTDYKLKVLKRMYADHTYEEIGKILGFSTVAVKTKARLIGLSKMQRFTAQEIAYVRAHYADTLTRKIADHLNRTESAIWGLAHRLGFEKSEAFLKSNDSGRLTKLTQAGRAYRFPKGIVPINKGKKQTEFMSAEGIERSKSTRFSKGQQPHNTLVDGAERVRHSKGRPYVWVRVSLGVWREKHRLVWQKNYGPIPKGFNVQFKDGDTQNCEPENLYLIKRSDQMNQNTIHRYPAEIKQAIKTLSKLKRKIKQYEKQD